MKLGFVSAILPDQPLEDVFQVASNIGYDCIEVMCWLPGRAERRYAGVTHIDITSLSKKKIEDIKSLINHHGVSISALGYYPNPLTPDRKARRTFVNHLKKLIKVAPTLGVRNVNTFVGRDPSKSVEQNWPDFLKTWRPIIEIAQKNKVKIGIENCPMLFTKDEWPGGKNLATSPAIWERMWRDIPSKYFGLNYDPSHLIWQHMDCVRPIYQYPSRLHHIHAKDVRIDKENLNQQGIMAYPNLWHTPKLPGMGDVNWGKFFSALTSVGYKGAVCVEVEDRAFEGSLENRIRSLKQSYSYLRQYIPE